MINIDTCWLLYSKPAKEGGAIVNDGEATEKENNSGKRVTRRQKFTNCSGPQRLGSNSREPLLSKMNWKNERSWVGAGPKNLKIAFSVVSP
jgi:hypothetical protein